MTETTEGSMASGTGRLLAAPLWKKILVGAAALLVVVGGGLQAVAHFKGGGSTTNQDVSAGGSRPSSGEFHNLGMGLRDASDGGGTTSPDVARVPRSGDAVDVPSEDFRSWSPALFKGGMSFLAGFCIGYALRTFLKLSALFVGLFFLGVFGLSYVGVVDVKWQLIDTFFQNVLVAVKNEASSFKTFVMGSLPSAGAAGVGLFTGFKKS